MKTKISLQKRYKVLVDYPLSPYKVGDILTTSVGCEKYPDVFRELNWYEERSEDELPQYVKFIWDGEIDVVRKVDKWIYTEVKDKAILYGFEHDRKNDFDTNRTSIRNWIPATEEEFNDFWNQMKKDS